MSRSYIIATGFHARPDKIAAMEWLWRVWLDNTRKYAAPREVIVLASGEHFPEELPDEPPTNWIHLSGDLGHCGDILSGRKPYHFSGGAMAVLTLAMLCYDNECDFIYKEQDTLAFGPWVERMCAEIGDHGCIFGNCHGIMPAQNSLMMVKHVAIPEFVRLYLGTPHERDPNQIAECKFARFEKERPDFFCRYSFGFDRERPIRYDDPVWHAQKLTPTELREISRRGLIPQEAVDNMPSVPGDKFTNG